jgi:hypothetical protein
LEIKNKEMNKKAGIAVTFFLLGVIMMGLFLSITYGRMANHLDCNENIERQYLEQIKK